MLAHYTKIATNVKKRMDLGTSEIIGTTIDSRKTSLLTYNKLKLHTYKKIKKIKED